MKCEVAAVLWCKMSTPFAYNNRGFVVTMKIITTVLILLIVTFVLAFEQDRFVSIGPVWRI